MLLSFILMLVSIMLFTIVSILGVVYSLLKALFTLNATQLKYMCRESIKQTTQFFIGIAVFADEYGNVYCGELLQYACTYNKNTLFIQSDTTVSAALGYVSLHTKITPFGLALRNLLDKLFEPNHCENAYEYWELYQKVKLQNKFNAWVNR
jgi:hypothetical protein